VYTDFEDLNAFVYHSASGVVLDGLIWCLGPYVDGTREYGTFRLCLARVTRAGVRRFCRIED
jgi:hypothetical protein